jgi:uncharacterized lipoprotein YmbA
VDLPGYLDRSELVSRPNANQIQLAEDERWGEPLADGFRRILRDDLEELLDTNRIVLHPFDVRSPPELVVVVDVSRFEPVGTTSRYAELVARWTLSTGREPRVLARAQTTVREPIAHDAGPDSEIAALSRALARFAFALASAVRAAEEREPGAAATVGARP